MTSLKSRHLGKFLGKLSWNWLLKLYSMSVLTCAFQISLAHAVQPIFTFLDEQIREGYSYLGPSQFDRFSHLVLHHIDRHGRVTPELQAALAEIESKYFKLLEPEKVRYQNLLSRIGAKTAASIQMPQDQHPFWLQNTREFEGFRSTPELPARADIVIVGAGLTGSSAAYHLISEARAGKKIVILEAQHPGAGSSGRNGGNFQLIHENYSGENCEGLVQERKKVLKRDFPAWSEQEVNAKAKVQAAQLLKFTLKNFDEMTHAFRTENLSCDYSPQGWLRLASSPTEELAVLEDVAMIEAIQKSREVTGPKIELLSPQEILARYHIPTPYQGRLIHDSGNYHPYKFVVGVLRKVLSEKIGLYTGVKVSSVQPIQAGTVEINTNEGKILANKVIVATNVFTPQIFPELSSIHCYLSQIATYEHLKNPLQGATITERGGDLYYNFPKSTCYDAERPRCKVREEQSLSTREVSESVDPRGMLNFGVDVGFVDPYKDLDSVFDPKVRSEKIFRETQELVNERFPDSQNQPPSRVWVGPMAFTEDRVPVIGFLKSKDIVVAAAFQGYGGSYCFHAGKVASQMALTGLTHPDVPEELFSPDRFLSRH